MIVKALSLIVVLTAIPARLLGVPLDDITGYWPEVLNLLCGSLVGAWIGATWATRMASATLYCVLAVLLRVHRRRARGQPRGDRRPALPVAGRRDRRGCDRRCGHRHRRGPHGVAGGELLIPTFVLLYAVDVKIAGSLSLAVSVPPMLVAFARYSRDGSFVVLRNNRRFVLTMAAGSVVGTLVGGALVGVISASVLIPPMDVVIHGSLRSSGSRAILALRRDVLLAVEVALVPRMAPRGTCLQPSCVPGREFRDGSGQG